MYPILLKLGPLTFYTYGLFFACAWLMAIQILLWQAKRTGYSATFVYDYIGWLLPVIIVGSRLLYVILNFTDYLLQPWRIFFLWEGGLFFHGGIIAGILVTIFYARKKKVGLGEFADTIGLALPLSHAIGRVGCFFAGCCYGSPTNLPWGIVFTHPDTLAPSKVRVHPTQLYEVVGNIIIFLSLCLITRKKKFAGQIVLSYAILSSLLRWWVETLRADFRGPLYLGLTLTQLIAGLILVVSVITYTIFSFRKI